VVDLERIADPAEIEMLAREARTMSAYHHPHVLPLHCSFVHGQQLWLVMPFMEVRSAARGSACVALLAVSQPASATSVQPLPLQQLFACVH
jgi:serine/threonine protein kinase